MSLLHTPFEVLDYWFNELHPHQWFEKSDEVDAEIRSRFSSLHYEATKGELFIWRKTTSGRLAEIIVLDQFSRNIYRGTRKAFENDSVALVLAEEMVQLGLDKELSTIERAFAYLPFMHSESKIIHEMALKLFSSLGDQNNLHYEVLHKNVIDRFGRFPHRNEVLGRSSTREEMEYMKNNPDF